jgi:hypothetical protein
MRFGSHVLFISEEFLALVASALYKPVAGSATADPAKARITVLYDAFGKDSTMKAN